jgi:ketosteroid isomerase-like protein
MKRMRFRAWIAVLAFATGACARSPAPEPFPQAAADAVLERALAHDAAGVASFYTVDAVLLPPDQETLSGRAAIEEYFSRTNPPGGPAVEVATVETFVFGDHAWRQGSFRVEGPGDAPTSGKFVELWKKVDGVWLIHRDIWNANAPSLAVPATDADSNDAARTDAASDEPA